MKHKEKGNTESLEQAGGVLGVGVLGRGGRHVGPVVVPRLRRRVIEIRGFLKDPWRGGGPAGWLAKRAGWTTPRGASRLDPAGTPKNKAHRPNPGGLQFVQPKPGGKKKPKTPQKCHVDPLLKIFQRLCAVIFFPVHPDFSGLAPTLFSYCNDPPGGGEVRSLPGSFWLEKKVPAPPGVGDSLT